VYAIELTDPHVEHDVLRPWTLTVKRGRCPGSAARTLERTP
jgi:hypothetical protein